MIGMRLLVRGVVVLGVVFAPVIGASSAAHAKTVHVMIEHFAFMPASIAVDAGDTVVVTNRDITPHTATAADGSWTTQDIASGKSEAIMVPATGDGAYFCKYHPAMKGRLNIKMP